MCAGKLVSRARNLAAHYKEMKIERFLVRIPGTWEGIQAVKQLEADGIPTHVTLIYRCVAPKEGTLNPENPCVLLEHCPFGPHNCLTTSLAAAARRWAALCSTSLILIVWRWNQT